MHTCIHTVVMSKGVLVVFVFVLSALTSSEAFLCFDVMPLCAADPGCHLLQTIYGSACGAAYSALGGGCSRACKDAYYQLVGNAVGKQYYGCDCGNNTMCQQQFKQTLLSNCFNGVLPPRLPVNSTVRPPSCNFSVVFAACSQDPTCGPLLAAYINECRFAFQAINCSQQCEQALMKVLRDPAGNHFTVCGCGDDTRCQGIVQNLAGTCFNSTILNVQPEPTPTATSGCTSIDVISGCNKDQTCAPRLSAYLNECNFAFQGVSCSQQCKQAFMDLLRDQVGNRFSVCDCGNGDTACEGAAQNLKTTCFNGTFPNVQREPTPTDVAATPKAKAVNVKANVQMVLMSAIMGFFLVIDQ